ncbi:hypothetical protein LAJ19_17280 (plasmid) [Deinococcus taeanensis]|uniref:hypothetical protein n=1 Tax=Deinococcus taeanensis TaxID=2737050 RepID=UPI001CDB975C|nr:hypothetical protein [Deinococcus taeanensis]UBV44528.1 hypothetical protein LAJ19_17280 [Deinococcus taeanensis]
MNNQKLLASIFGTALLLASCGRTTPAAPLTTQALASALHDDTTGGTDGFFLLSPVVTNPTVDGDINPDLAGALTVRVDQISFDHSTVVSVGPEYSAANGLVFVDAAFNANTGRWSNPHYQFDWNTATAGLDNNKYYRVSVLLNGASLGHVDIDPAPTGTDRSKKKPTPDYVTVVNGRILPVKFHITNVDAPNSTAPAQVTLSATYQATTVPSPVTVTDTSSVTLSVNAYDRTGVAAVDFYKNDVLVATDSTPADGLTYTESFNSTQNGTTATYTVVARDAAENASDRSESPTVSVTVAIPEETPTTNLP